VVFRQQEDPAVGGGELIFRQAVLWPVVLQLALPAFPDGVDVGWSDDPPKLIVF
jgi:hypothetical protein